MADKEQPGLYNAPGIVSPSNEDIKRISDTLKLKCTQEEVQACVDRLKSMSGLYMKIASMPGPELPVKYPRTPGYRPGPEENKYNAWYYKCEIKGAASGKLTGKRIGIKDNTAVAGVPMMNGSKLMEGYVPEFDATVVTRILDAGGTIAGKTSTEDMCCDGNSFSNVTGPILNPIDPSRSSGGSSSGSGVLVALGEIDMAIGGDQGGSIRIPSSWCGIVGLKPTLGLVPYTGAFGVEPTIDHLGPMARTVEDCALLLEVIAGYDDGMDPRQPPHLQVPEYTKLLKDGIKGKRIGLVTEGFSVCKQDVQDVVRKAAHRLTEAGASVEDVSIPIHSQANGLLAPIFVEGAVNCLWRGYGSGYHWKGFYPISMQEFLCRSLTSRPHDMPAGAKISYMTGEFIRENYQNKFYAKAQNLGIHVTRAYNEVLKKYNVLIMPTLPMTPPKLPDKSATVKELSDASGNMASNTVKFNYTGHPALSINAGTSEGLPVGMQIVGRHFDETSVLQVAYAFEKLQ